MYLDSGTDPPHRIGGEPEAAIGIEALDRLHHPDIALRDQLRKRQPIAAISHRDLGDETQMAGYQAVRGLGVFMLFPAFGEHVLFFWFEHRKLADLLEIPGQVSFSGNGRDRKGGH